MNKAIIDIETGGFSITKNGVVEIGVLIIDENHVPITEHNWIIKPYTRPDSDELVSYKDDAMAVHGITIDEIEKGTELEEVIRQLIDILVEYNTTTFIGHNVKTFDLPRLKYLFEKCNAPNFLDRFDVKDTLEICREHLSLPCNKLESICEHFGIDNTDKHRALGDCYATLEVYKRLTN